MPEPTSVAVVHPVTGELLDGLTAQPPEALADVAFALRAQQSALRKMQAAVDAELRRRLDIRGRHVAVFGGYEVGVGRESTWDADELEGVLRDLVDGGVVQAGEVTEVIRHETTVSRNEAKRLLTRLREPARSRIERCMTWKTTGRLRIERSVLLTPPPGEVSPPPTERAA